MTVRISPAEPQGIDPVRRLTYWLAKRTYGRVLEPSTAVAHHRPLLVGFGAIALAADRFAHAVDQRHKHLAQLRAAQLIGCEWCLDFGSRLAQDSGIPEQDLRELATWRHSARFDLNDRLVLEYAEAMTRTPVEVPDELFARLRESFDERQIVELTMTIALENLYSRFNWSMGIEGEGFAEGMYCVSPQTTLLERQLAPR
jgi:AhpD family alkylhydroperoxidase